MGLRVVSVRRGARILEGDCVLSEVLAKPGPTNCLFDVLAMTIRALSPGERVLLLGFAGGGVVGPLRASGWSGALEAVDLDLTGYRVFEELGGSWCGSVRVHRAEAVRWLRQRRDARFDLILEDLSVAQGRMITKPEVSLEDLPGLMRSRLAPGGVAVTNVLPVPGWSWRDLLTVLARPWPRAIAITFEDWENRLLVTGTQLATARHVSRRLRAALRALGSDQSARLSVRTFRG